MRHRRVTNLYVILEILFEPKKKQVATLVHEVLRKQKQLTGSARVIHKGQLFDHPQHPKDHLSNTHPSLQLQFDECVVQTKEYRRLRQRVTEYLTQTQYKYPNAMVWAFIPSSVHSWFNIEYKGKVSDDIPDWFIQLCAELSLLRMIYAND